MKAKRWMLDVGLFLLILAMCCLGCGVQGIQSVAAPKVYVDPAVPMPAALSALAMWNDSVGTRFSVTDDQRISDVTIVSVSDDCGASGDGQTFVGYDDEGTTQAAICMGYFKGDLTTPLLSAVIAHEIGHVMGLHHLPQAALMYHSVTADSVITEADIAAFWSRWGQL